MIETTTSKDANSAIMDADLDTDTSLTKFSHLDTDEQLIDVTDIWILI